mgnify:CR=1 FL=1
MPRQSRRQYFVNGKVQGALACRIALYWFFCLLTVATMTAFWLVLFDRPASAGEFAARMATQTAPVLLSSVLLLPLVILDSVRHSNRFVGPILRLGRALDRMADGQRVHNIEFRNDDFWYEHAQSFNRLNERVIALEEQLKAAQAASSASQDETPELVASS